MVLHILLMSSVCEKLFKSRIIEISVKSPKTYFSAEGRISGLLAPPHKSPSRVTGLSYSLQFFHSCQVSGVGRRVVLVPSLGTNVTLLP